jgi:hypothetical protein
MPSPAVKLASLAIPVASLLSLTACRGVVVAGSAVTPAGTTAVASTAAPTAASSAPATSAPATSAANTPSGAGTLSVSMTSPVSESGTAAASVTCARTAVLYVASANNAQVAGYDHSFTLRVGRYRGPGTYPGAALTYTVTGPEGGIASVTGVLATPVTITSTGGSFTVDRTGRSGTTLDATVTWTCPV